MAKAPIHTTTLHAPPGMASLHIAGEEHKIGADGTVAVATEHVEAALSVGLSHAPHAAEKKPHVDRLADLESRVAALEAGWAAAGPTRSAKKA